MSLPKSWLPKSLAGGWTLKFLLDWLASLCIFFSFFLQVVSTIPKLKFFLFHKGKARVGMSVIITTHCNLNAFCVAATH